jgi:hypothetical protein
VLTSASQGPPSQGRSLCASAPRAVAAHAGRCGLEHRDLQQRRRPPNGRGRGGHAGGAAAVAGGAAPLVRAGRAAAAAREDAGRYLVDTARLSHRTAQQARARPTQSYPSRSTSHHPTTSTLAPPPGRQPLRRRPRGARTRRRRRLLRRQLAAGLRPAHAVPGGVRVRRGAIRVAAGKREREGAVRGEGAWG